MLKRFRKTKGGRPTDVWVEVGILRYTIELYEDGAFVGRKGGFVPRAGNVEVFLSGKDFASLVTIHPDRTVRCTLSR